MEIDREPTVDENDPSDPNAPTGLGPDDEGVGNIRPEPAGDAERFPGTEADSPQVERADDLGPRP